MGAIGSIRIAVNYKFIANNSSPNLCKAVSNTCIVACLD
nr:MAG TPA: hypothetical protein [Caudoviricetes sp.]